MSATNGVGVRDYPVVAESRELDSPAPSPVRERGILMSGPMVRATLREHDPKTMTRRVVLPEPSAGVRRSPFVPSGLEDGHGREIRLVYGRPGDRLYVREAWGYDWYDNGQDRAWKRVIYRADDESAQPQDQGVAMPWKPSIHMPRRFSRITLEITNVRVERLQEMRGHDAVAEGILDLDNAVIRDRFDMSPAQSRHVLAEYRALWNLLNEKRGYGWASNPWVWVISFRKMSERGSIEGQKCGHVHPDVRLSCELPTGHHGRHTAKHGAVDWPASPSPSLPGETP